MEEVMEDDLAARRDALERERIELMERELALKRRYAASLRVCAALSRSLSQPACALPSRAPSPASAPARSDLSGAAGSRPLPSPPPPAGFCCGGVADGFMALQTDCCLVLVDKLLMSLSSTCTRCTIGALKRRRRRQRLLRERAARCS